VVLIFIAKSKNLPLKHVLMANFFFAKTVFEKIKSNNKFLKMKGKKDLHLKLAQRPSIRA